MSVYQISRIQHRRGTSGELPDALADGELGVTTDTGEIFIGAPNHPSVSGRQSYPYKNIKLITELDVQRGIKGDVYYHGALAGARLANTGVWTSIIPLFGHGARDFATYDFAVSTPNRATKVVGVMSLCVHPTDPDQSILRVESKAAMGWPHAQAFLDTNHFKVTRYDLEGVDSGVTWLSMLNNTGLELIVSVSGREWSNPAI